MLRHARIRAVSLVELLAVVSILGVLASITVPHIDVVRASQEQLALDEAEMANRAVLHYEQVNKRLGIAAADASTLDEIRVLIELKRDDLGIAGYSPYMTQDFPEDMSASADDYRLAWTGRNFRLLVPGATGAGIKVGGD
jgi:prepilin-type N-terminal cleavage/methylation domain-containing protein